MKVGYIAFIMHEIEIETAIRGRAIHFKSWQQPSTWNSLHVYLTRVDPSTQLQYVIIHRQRDYKNQNHPEMLSPNIPELSTGDHATLKHLSSLLHLFTHRNKNQHRRSTWWRHFSAFRRQLNDIVHDYEKLQQKPTTHLARIRKTGADKLIKTDLNHRLNLWQNILVPKWHRAFSQLVADGRFAVLGVVLLAVLSQVCRILGIIEGYEDLGQEEVEKVIEGFGREFLGHSMAVGSASGREREEVGVVVERETDGSTPAESIVATTTTTTTSDKAADTKAIPTDTKRATISQPQARKKKRKANAIDDLFGALD